MRLAVPLRPVEWLEGGLTHDGDETERWGDVCAINTNERSEGRKKESERGTQKKDQQTIFCNKITHILDTYDVKVVLCFVGLKVVSRV